MSRAALFAGTSTMLAVASCSAYGQPPPCPHSVELSAPCGIVDVKTRCAGASTASCKSGTDACSVGPIASDCPIVVKLGDGTTQTINVTVGQSSFCSSTNIVTSPRDGFQSLQSATCHAPFPPEASVDAEVDAPDDATSDADATLTD